MSQILNRRKAITLNRGENVSSGFNEDEMVKKGHLSEPFLYGSSNLQFSKKGSEIKVKITEQKKYETESLAKCKMEAEALLAECGEEPDKEIEGDKAFSIKSKGLMVPMVFSWEFIREVRNDENMKGQSGKKFFSSVQALRGDSEIMEVSSNDSENSLSGCLELFNDKSYKIVECLCEILLLESLENNLVDSKEYELTLSQLTTLGF